MKKDKIDLNENDFTILAVDDEEFVLEMLKDILEDEFGYKVVAFTNPIKALKAFNKDPEMFDLVISDVKMPEMSGVQMTSKMKDLKNDIPIIITTGYAEKQEADLLEDSGVDAFIRKPFKHDKLHEIIKNLLNIT